MGHELWLFRLKIWLISISFRWLSFTLTVPSNVIYLADFTNLVPLATGQEYYQTTLSSGKKILFISSSATTYQGAVDTCSSHGADVLLPIDQAENDDVMAFLQIHWEARHFGLYSPIAWMRIIRTDRDSSWVDAKTDEPLVYDGPEGRFGGLNNWPYDGLNAFVGESDGWKGYPGDVVHAAIICELPSLWIFLTCVKHTKTLMWFWFYHIF